MATIFVTSNKTIDQLVYTPADTISIRDGATLTVNATPSVKPLAVECKTSGKLLIKNTNTTSPIFFELATENGDFTFSGNGVFEVQGGMIEIGTANGSQMTWDFSTLFGGSIDHLKYVEVETDQGTGQYAPYPVLESSPLLTTDYGGLASNINVYGSCIPTTISTVGEAGDVFFFDFMTRKLKTGDGTTYGRVIPSGRRIRIPNIFIGNANKMYSSLAISLATIGTPTGGTFTLNVYHGRTRALIGKTVAIPYNGTIAQIDAALGTVLGSTSNVTTTGTALPAVVTITGAGTYAGIPLMITVASSALTGGTSAKVFTTLSNVDSVSIINLTPSGTFIGEGCQFSSLVRWEVTTFSQITMKKVGLGGHNGFYASNSNGTVDLESVSVSTNPYSYQEICGIANVFGEIKLNQCTWLSPISQGAFNFLALPSLSLFKDTKFYASGVGTSTARYLINITSPKLNLTLENIWFLGGRASFTNCTGIQVLNSKVSDNIFQTSGSSPAANAFTLLNVISAFFYNVTLGGSTVCKNNLFYIGPQSFDITILNVNIDCKNICAGLANLSNNQTIIENCNLLNIRTTGLVQQSPAFPFIAAGGTFKKLLGTFATAHTGSALPAGQSFYYNGVTVSEFGFTQTHIGVESFVGGNFLDESAVPVTGHITFGAFGLNGSLELIGKAYTNQLGAVVLPTMGDSFVATMPFTLNGITSFNNTFYEYACVASVQSAYTTINTLLCINNSNAGNAVIGVYNNIGTLLGTITVNHLDTIITLDTKFTTYGGDTTVTGTWTTGYVITTATPISCVLTDNTCTLDGIDVTVSIAGSTTLTANNLFPTVLPLRMSTNSISFQYALKTPEGAWSSYTAVNDIHLISSALNELLSSLTNYSPEEGLQIRLKVTALIDNDLQSVNQISVKTNVDTAKILTYNGSVNLLGVKENETVLVKRVSDNTLLYSFVGGGLKQFDVGIFYNTNIRYERYSIDNIMIASSTLINYVLKFGKNPDVHLFTGDEVQLAQNQEVTSILNQVNSLVTDCSLLTTKVTAVKKDTTFIKSIVA